MGDHFRWPQGWLPARSGLPMLDDTKRDEDRRIEQLRRLVDGAVKQLRHPEMGWEEGRALIERVREQALELFPQKEQAFDLIYKPRFHRILDEKFHML